MSEDRASKYAAPDDDIPLSDLNTIDDRPPSYNSLEKDDTEKPKGPGNTIVAPNNNNSNNNDNSTVGSPYPSYNYQPYPPQPYPQPYPPQPYPPQQQNQPYPQPNQQNYPPQPYPNSQQPNQQQEQQQIQHQPYPPQPYPPQSYPQGYPQHYQPYPPPSTGDGQPPASYTYAIPAYPVYSAAPGNTTVAAYHPMNGQQPYVLAGQNVVPVAVTSSPGHHSRHDHQQGLACGIGMAWVLFIVGWFTIFAWLAGSFYMCLGDKRERKGGIANFIALVIIVIIIVISVAF